MKVSVSILNSNDIKKDLELLNNTSCDYLHIDVMDNKFVSNKNNPYDILKYYESDSKIVISEKKILSSHLRKVYQISKKLS